ncbi:hypothetical protein EYB53_021675 [Candidatus Chloroploca sp. M-50]|uniref:Uncharacterized protein n=1 Tax=Candidatus Chloroploca mongolica TaxID=2528176 RepID=A0ABS4DFW4_9CHLR|nr:hypothetical protein [Candidatus Chloroploca mongolica]MBP1468336.1 hypothetical protein [Candidatus Chloroploca mongolica]
MSYTPDRLYELLPTIYRVRDAEQGYPLRELLRIVNEQAQVLDDDITQLYNSWFIEVCPDWVVPYLGDLVGYRPIRVPRELRLPASTPTRPGNRILVPRREVANTIAYRRRKGTLALLEQLAHDVAGWPARAVEFGQLLLQTQSLNSSQLERGHTINLRDIDALERLDSPFDTSAHSVDVRRVSAPALQGRYNLPSVGLFVWRLRSFPLTHTRPRRLVQQPNCFTFSPLGNDTPLYTDPQAEQSAETIAGELNVPTIIRRRALADNINSYYGPGKSLCLFDGSEPISADRIVVADLTGWQREPQGDRVMLDPLLGRFVFPRRRLPKDPQVSYHYGYSAAIGGGEYDRPLPDDTLATALLRVGHLLGAGAAMLHVLRAADDARTRWLREQLLPDLLRRIDAPGGEKAPDEVLQLALREGINQALLNGPWDVDLWLQKELPSLEIRALVGLAGSAAVRLNRLLLEAAFPKAVARSYGHYTVTSRAAGRQEINEALRKWRRERPRHAVIEIADSGLYIEPISIELEAQQSLEIRAAPGCRPVIRLVEVESAIADLHVTGEAGSRFSLDGILVVGYGLRVEGDLAAISIRDSTLVPGWDLDADCAPASVDQPSLRILDAPLPDDGCPPPAAAVGTSSVTQLMITQSILGTILISRDEVRQAPLEIMIADSILDATGPGREALSASDCGFAHATLTISRSTVFGEILTHAIALAEDSIFTGEVRAARRQYGCVRFCSLPPESRTPRRYHCQPDLAIAQAVAGLSNVVEQAVARREATEQVRPRFASERYGTPTYARLTCANAAAILRGAANEAEMGVFHDLYELQRLDNLQARLDEYMPAGFDVGIISII